MFEQTPAEKLGYSVGDKFEVIERSSYEKGSIVTLYQDDGTEQCLFTGEGTIFTCGPNNTPGAVITLSRLRKLTNAELYTPGEKFKVLVEHCGFKVGTIVTLQKIEGCGLFAGENSVWENAQDENGKRIPGAWGDFKHMEKIVEPELPETVYQEVYEKFVPGVSYKVVDLGFHGHWYFNVGDTVVATERGLPSGTPSFLRSPYPTMMFEVLGVLPEKEVDIKPALESLKELQAYCHNVSVKAGWWNDVTTGEKFDPVAKGPEKIALMHSELSEALEGLRKGLMDDKLPHRANAEVELADAVIRILDWAGAMGYDIAGAIEDKLAFNANRPDHKLENRQAAGGKKF